MVPLQAKVNKNHKTKRNMFCFLVPLLGPSPGSSLVPVLVLVMDLVVVLDQVQVLVLLLVITLVLDP